jgi:hypothetical protein
MMNSLQSITSMLGVLCISLSSKSTQSTTCNVQALCPAGTNRETNDAHHSQPNSRTSLMPFRLLGIPSRTPTRDAFVDTFGSRFLEAKHCAAKVLAGFVGFLVIAVTWIITRLHKQSKFIKRRSLATCLRLVPVPTRWFR